MARCLFLLSRKDKKVEKRLPQEAYKTTFLSPRPPPIPLTPNKKKHPVNLLLSKNNHDNR